jgi:hypothetical protein
MFGKKITRVHKNPNRSSSHQDTKKSLWLKFYPFTMHGLAAMPPTDGRMGGQNTRI